MCKKIWHLLIFVDGPTPNMCDNIFVIHILVILKREDQSSHGYKTVTLYSKVWEFTKKCINQTTFRVGLFFIVEVIIVTTFLMFLRILFWQLCLSSAVFKFDLQIWN